MTTVVDDRGRVVVHIQTTAGGRNLLGSFAPFDRVIAIGGYAEVQHNKRIVADGENPPRRLTKRTDGWLTFRTIEKMAKRDPRGEWIVSVNGPLWSATWVRQRPGKWVCVETGMGFA